MFVKISRLQDVLKRFMKGSMLILTSLGTAGFVVFCLMAIGIIPFSKGIALTVYTVVYSTSGDAVCSSFSLKHKGTLM